jgi:acetoin utilization protein AcuC
MTDSADPAFVPWGDGVTTDRVDGAVVDSRRALFPLHGLDPDDPRD